MDKYMKYWFFKIENLRQQRIVITNRKETNRVNLWLLQFIVLEEFMPEHKDRESEWA